MQFTSTTFNLRGAAFEVLLLHLSKANVVEEGCQCFAGSWARLVLGQVPGAPDVPAGVLS